jgi:hypothetical protein
MACSSNTLIINYQLPWPPKRRAHAADIALRPLNITDDPTPRLKPKLTSTRKRTSREHQHCPKQDTLRHHNSTLSNQEVQYLTLVSNSVGKKGPVCAIFQAHCQKNFISNRIVKRFNLTSYVDSSANTSAAVAGEGRITPSRSYVTLVARTAVGNQQSPHRFYVVEHCLETFDILIGSNIITNLLSLAKQDEPIGSIPPIRSKQ